ncbi:MAG TPA: carboxypeptidase-like regulatory domain-containing protein [Candidatus Acidoferrum sp.]|nr:carboxypeptidase-like regulatory domain-containing protein [Candidatus Acidoferrum sp.]
MLAAVFALAGFGGAVYAQQATIVGTVTDPSGAVIPNVSVTITNTDTGVAHAFQTNDAGQYVAPDLQIGHYTLKAEAKGFKASEEKNVVLTVGDRIRMDFQMQLGAAQETVTVEANTVHVQTDSGEQSNLITDQQMSQLAISGRSIYQLAALTPGASSQIGAGGMSSGVVNTPVGGDAGVEFNGMRQNHNIYLLDGGEDDDRGGAGGMSIAPSSDAIAEFRALTSNYSADYGLSSAGTMTMVLKSGTSQFHASAWEFNRNDFFDAQNFFIPNTELRLNVFGFNVGGPVTFGHLYNPDKKKTFFFYNMEWRRLVQGGATNQTVPATATYGGNFNGFVPGDVISKKDNAPIPFSGLHAPCAIQLSPALQQIFITAGQAFSTPTAGGSCVVDANATVANNPTFVPFNASTLPFLNANAQALLKAGIFPGNNALASNGSPEFRGGANTPTNLKEEIVRIDHNFTDRFSVFGHFIAEQVSQGFATSQWSGDNVPTVGDNFGNPSYSAVVHTTYTISPTLVNEVAFNYNGNRINIVPYAASGLQSLSLPSAWTSNRLFTGKNNSSRIPNIDLSGGSGAQFEISSWPWHNSANDYQIRDDVSWTKGAHQFRIGGSWALYKKVQDLFGQTQGGFNFNGNYTGNSFADMLLGLPDSYQELAVQDQGLWNNVSTALWFQDNWRVNRRLTLNLGLRWDGVPHTYEANNRMGNFYPQLYNPALAATFDKNNSICSASDVANNDPKCNGAISPGLGTSPNSILAGVPLYLNGIGIEGKCYTSPTNFCVPKDLVNNHWAAFGPRVGFAYDVTGSGKTVVRGGFGMMYERIQGNDMYNAGPNIPFSLQVNLNSVELDNPSIATNSGTAATQPINAASITGLAVNNYKLPVSYQYSVGVQHSLTSKTVLSVSYVGNQSRHQNDYRNVNLPPAGDLASLIGGSPYQTATGLPYSGFAGIILSNNEANTHYNSLQVDLNSRLGRDLTLRAFYTLSRAMDPTTSGSGGGDLGNVSNPYAGWLYDVGPSGYDRTHIGVVDFIYDIPLFRNSESHWLKSTAGGWEVSGIVTMESGLPINIGISGNQGGNGVPNGVNRPDLTGTIAYPHTVASWFDTSAFSLPTLGAWGTLAHNALRGPGRDNWNISLFKTFTLSESRGSRLELRLETFNTWNHTQLNAVDSNLGDNRFGQVTSAFDPRVLQLGGKIYF